MRFVKTAVPSGLQITVIEQGIYVYPNPASDVITIKSANFKYSQVEIYNLEGKKIFSKIVTNYSPEFVLPISLPEGHYFLSLSNQEERRMVKLMLK